MEEKVASTCKLSPEEGLRLISWLRGKFTKAMISSRSERMNGHIGTETRSRLTGGSSGESSAMGESLTEQRR